MKQTDAGTEGRKVVRRSAWTIGRDAAEGASPPIREVECTACGEGSQADTAQMAGDLWALQHTGDTGHRGVREIVTGFLRTRPADQRPH